MPRKPRKAVSIYKPATEVELVKGGEDFFTLLLDIIDGAEHSLHLQTYIYEADETGTQVADALLQAAKRGVKVYVLADGYASNKLPADFIQKLKDGGVQFRWFEPLLRASRFYFGRRLHHKIVVADGWYGLTGGINISNRYNDMPGESAWMDWAIYMEGEVSAELYYVCLEYWNRSGWGRRSRERINEPPPEHTGKANYEVRVRRNDWVKGKIQVTQSYLEMCRHAKQHIIIMSSYFLPGHIMRKALEKAAKRGVKVQVIAASQSDIWVSKYAERYLYRWLLRQGIELYEYQPNVLHSKLSTYDGKWVTAGSYNVNNISAYASVELNVDVLNDSFARLVEDRLHKVIDEECKQVQATDYAKYSWYSRLGQWGSYQFVRLVLYLFTFYFRQSNR